VHPSEFIFTAKLDTDSVSITSSNEVKVNKEKSNTELLGDGNQDGSVNLTDLSLILTNWNKNSNFPIKLDINTDGVINSFDFAALIQILISNQVI
jgi:hypothetical protein